MPKLTSKLWPVSTRVFGRIAWLKRGGLEWGKRNDTYNFRLRDTRLAECVVNGLNYQTSNFKPARTTYSTIQHTLRVHGLV
jgi:hypothetical protein